MNDKDIDPSMVHIMATDKNVQEYHIKYLCDETTFMMFDLERGGFINYHGETVDIDDGLWKFYYKRVPVEESIENGIRNIISNFFISATYNNKIVLDFEVYGGERKFRIKHIEGFHANMFLKVLDSFRMKKFQINLA